jgi:autotransporter-associated beta strand protein/predicted outer membrane repeat protein
LSPIGSSNATLTIDDSSFSENSAGSFGGAIGARQGIQTITESSFSGNRAPSGGAIFNGNQGITATITDCSFTRNTATNGGAIVFAINNTATIADSSFTLNTAVNGGAIYINAVSSPSTITIADSSFTLNTAATNGGAIYNNVLGTINLDVSAGRTSTFSGNTAAGLASSIFFQSGALNVNLAANGLLDMRDPMSGNPATVTETGPGVWALGGANSLTNTTFSVSSGTLYLYKSGEVPNTGVSTVPATTGTIALSGSGSRFTLGDGATLVAAGDNRISASTITLANGAAIRGGTAADGNLVHVPLSGPITSSLTSPNVFDLEGQLTVQAVAPGDIFTLNANLADAAGSKGSLLVPGMGTVILTGANTYSGGTFLNGGTLAVEGNGHLGTGPLTFKGGTLEDLTGGNLLSDVDIELAPAGGTFLADASTTSALNGPISGPGSFTKAGPGTLILTGNNTFSGGTTINEGTLVVGVPAGSSSDTSFALGTGNVFLNGGTLRTTSLDPKPLIINVGGNYTQKADGTLALGIGGTQPGQFDRVVVTGSANLGGTLQVFSLNNFHPSPGNEFGIFRNSGTRTGSFTLDDSLFNNANIPRALRPVAVELVAPNGVDLVYLKPGTPAPPVVEVPDPTTVQLTALFEIPFSGANIQRLNLDDRMTQIQRTIVPPPPAPAPPTGKETVGKETIGKAPPAPAYQPGPRWGVWANGWGDFVNIDDAGLAKGYRFTTGGFSAGIDYRITDHFAVGLFGGYSHTWMDFRPGDGDVDTGRGGLYATYFDPTGWWVNAGVWGGYNSYSTSRQSLLGRVNGSTEGYEFSTFGDAGYNIYWGKLTFGPIVAMQYTTAHISGFTEHGSLVPLDIHADSEDSLRTDLGAQASYNWQVGKIVVIPGLRLAWEHEFKYSHLPITASVPTFGGATATLNGPNLGHDSLLINANVGIQITPRIWATIGYDGQVARNHYSSHAVSGTFSFSF